MSYYKKGEKSRNQEAEERSDNLTNRSVDSIVLEELVAYIKESRYATELSERIFKLSKLASLYKERLELLEEKTSSRIHTSQ